MFIKGRLICDAAGEHRHINLVEMRKQHEADGKSGEVAESRGPALIPPPCALLALGLGTDLDPQHLPRLCGAQPPRHRSCTSDQGGISGERCSRSRAFTGP